MSRSPVDGNLRYDQIYFHYSKVSESSNITIYTIDSYQLSKTEHNQANPFITAPGLISTNPRVLGLSSGGVDVIIGNVELGHVSV